MARNRKRARERRPADASSLATARDSDASADPLDPLNHVSGVEELAEAQLALGRPELADVPDQDELTDFEESEAGGGGGCSAGRLPSVGSSGGGGGSGGGIVGPGGSGGRSPAPRENPGARLAGFLQGSWRELQRVQWP